MLQEQYFRNEDSLFLLSKHCCQPLEWRSASYSEGRVAGSLSQHAHVCLAGYPTKPGSGCIVHEYKKVTSLCEEHTSRCTPLRFDHTRIHLYEIQEKMKRGASPPKKNTEADCEADCRRRRTARVDMYVCYPGDDRPLDTDERQGLGKHVLALL